MWGHKMAKDCGVEGKKTLDFRVMERNKCISGDRLTVFLRRDNWDDYTFNTTFDVVLFDENKRRYDLGCVKIGYFKQQKATSTHTKLNDNFFFLDENFFSLGQDLHYYKALSTLTPWVKENFLKSMRDMVFDKTLREEAIEEEVTTTSLLRFVSKKTLERQFVRVLNGGSDLKSYDFAFSYKNQIDLKFNVNPDNPLPTNIHVLIGGNGVGKTSILKSMIFDFLKEKERNEGHFDDDFEFSRLISISHSVFDDQYPLEAGYGYYSYIGLLKEGQEIKTKSDLAAEFANSLNACRKFKNDDWLSAIENLQSDPIFRQYIDTELLKEEDKDNECGKNLFKALSSGHSFILLTITKLVEKLEEETLVLLDEPETHLHPPLLSTFIHAVSSLLKRKNAVAIIVTHSPVVVQEIPRQCVWKLSRIGDKMKAQRFECETFGENFGKIMREVFGLEARESGFYKMIAQDAESGESFENIVQKYDNQLGSEARMILLSLLRENDG